MKKLKMCVFYKIHHIFYYVLELSINENYLCIWSVTVEKLQVALITLLCTVC